jgi:hypothetical protein
MGQSIPLWCSNVAKRMSVCKTGAGRDGLPFLASVVNTVVNTDARNEDYSSSIG